MLCLLCYVMFVMLYVMLWYVMLFYVMLCYVTLCYFMLWYVMLCIFCYVCFVMLFYAMLCYAMLCYITLCYICYVILCYVMLCYGRRSLIKHIVIVLYCRWPCIFWPITHNSHYAVVMPDYDGGLQISFDKIDLIFLQNDKKRRTLKKIVLFFLESFSVRWRFWYMY